MPRLAVSLLIAAGLATAATTARADGRTRAPGADRAREPFGRTFTRETWYGWQTLAADAGTVVVLTASEGSDLAATASLGLYLGAAPAIHLLHGHEWRALGSAGLRVGLPVAGALAGGLAGEAGLVGGSGDDARLAGGVLGGLLGTGAAIVTDAAVAFDKEEIPRPAWSGDFSIAPTLVADAGGTRVGVAGTF